MIYDLPGFSTRPKWIQNEESSEDRKFREIMQMREDRSARWMRGNRNIISRLREQREELMHASSNMHSADCVVMAYSIIIVAFIIHHPSSIILAYSIITVAFIIHHLYQILKSMMDQLSNK